MIVYETLWLTFLGLVAAVLVHEGGHIAGALAVGIAPRVLTLGVGPVVMRLRRGAFVVVLRAMPLTGYVLVEPSGRFWAYFALVAGGPLANLLAFATSLWAAAAWPDAVAPAALAIFQGLFAVATLFPSRGRISGLSVASDGLQMFRLLRARKIRSLGAAFAPLAAPLSPAGAAPPAPTRHTAKLLFALCRADQLADPWARSEAVSSLRSLLPETDLTSVERAVVLCQLCSYVFLYDEGLGSAAEADAWSRDALALSGEPTAFDTRGSALLLSGHVVEAERLLRSALGRHGARGEAEGLGAVLCRALLARALDAAGRTDEASALQREVEAAPAIANNPALRAIVTRIKSRAVAARPTPASLPRG